MYTVIYYSPTGNAAYLAKHLSTNLEPNKVTLLPLEFTDAAHLTHDGHLVLLFPIHAFNAPALVKQFVKDIPAGLYESVSLLAVGSADMWLNHAASLEARQILEGKGYTIMLDEVLAMPLTIVMLLKEDVIHQLVADAEQKIGAISKALVEGTRTVHTIPAKAKLLKTIAKVEPLAARIFGLELHASDACISCGTCWQNCPAKNITRGNNGRPKFGFSCTMCMRCIYNCPTQAISPRFSKFVPIKGGYSLEDYLQSE